MKIPVAELSTLRLTLLVAQHDPRCEGLTFERRDDHWVGMGEVDGKGYVCAFITTGNAIRKMQLRRKYDGAECYDPTENWAIGGPIIEREKIHLSHRINEWSATKTKGPISAYGSSPLIAAMRCYVASKFGEEVQVPEELA